MGCTDDAIVVHSAAAFDSVVMVVLVLMMGLVWQDLCLGVSGFLILDGLFDGEGISGDSSWSIDIITSGKVSVPLLLFIHCLM